MGKKSKRWIEQPLRVLDLVFTPRLDDYPMEEAIAECKRMHANVIHFHCQYNMRGGFSEHEMYFKSRLSKKDNRDVLGEFLPLAEKEGIRTVVYLNLHWYTKTFVEENPDWWVVFHNGERLDHLYGDDDSSFCINSPWRDWSFTLLEDVCAYPIDGVFFDGPVYFRRRGACFCQHCRKSFQQTYQKEMPAADQGNREDYALLREFTVSSMVKYYHDAMQIVRKGGSDLVGYGNYANVAEPDWAAGRVNRRLIPEMDALLAEGGFMYGRASKAVYKTGASSRLYEIQAGDKPSINAVSMAFSPWRWISLSPSETKVLLSEASVGVNPYYAIFLQGIDMPGIDAAAEVYGFLEKHEKYYKRTTSSARVALLQSGQTLNCYSGVDLPWTDLGYQDEQQAQSVGNYSRSFYGFYEMMIRARIPFDIVDETFLMTSDLARYEAIVLPNAACLSDVQCAALADFVRAGGKLVADFESSHYDETGARRDDFGLSELFGASSDGGLSEHRRWDYVFVADSEAGHLNWMETNYFPAPRRNLNVKMGTGHVQAVFSSSLVSNIIGVAQRTDDPFLIENKFGEGVSYFFPTMFGEFFEETSPDMYPRILKEILGTEVSGVQLSGAANQIDIHVRTQAGKKRTMVHLINLELGGTGEILPALGCVLAVDVDHEVKKATALRAGKQLKFKTKKGKVRLALPELSEFEVVVLEA
jgi:hypothetical protein